MFNEKIISLIKVEVNTFEEGITLKLIYEIQKEIGVKAVEEW